jgi:hypothetical protein
VNRVINDIYEQVAGGEENLSQVERWTSMLGGVVLAAAGLRVASAGIARSRPS